ncbi:hypothetical protein Tco_0148937 [Tanacetum coccineum]
MVCLLSWCENDLPKPVTPHYLLKVRESVLVKPYHVIAPGSSRNSQEESYGSNDMAYNYFIEEARKTTQERNRNLKPREMPSARTHHTPNACKPKPRMIEPNNLIGTSYNVKKDNLRVWLLKRLISQKPKVQEIQI